MKTIREYLDSKKELQHQIQPFREKRVYISDPSQAPSGANVQMGKHGGHYYDTEGKMDKAPADTGDIEMTAEQEIEKVINMMALNKDNAEDIYQELERRFGPDVALANRDEISKSVGQEIPGQEPVKQDFLNDELDQKITGEISSLAGTYAKEDEIYNAIEKKYGKDMAKLYKDDIESEVKRVYAIDDPDVAGGYKPEPSQEPAGEKEPLPSMWDTGLWGEEAGKDIVDNLFSDVNQVSESSVDEEINKFVDDSMKTTDFESAGIDKDELFTALKDGVEIAMGEQGKQYQNL